MATEADANAVLAGVAAWYGTPDDEIAERNFVEEVEVVRKYTEEPTALLSIEEGIEYITAGNEQPRVYVIRRGDSLWDIAAVNGIALSELMEMNPALDPRDLTVGQEVYIYEVRPLLTAREQE